MRIFVAIPISKSSKEKIFDVASDYKNINVRWIKDKNLHITIVPPWNENEVQKIIDLLSKYKPTNKPIKIEFTNISAGPNKNNPRLIWITGKTTDKLSKLKDDIYKLLNKPQNSREFLPHLTIARFNPSNLARNELNKIKNIYRNIYIDEQVSEFVIMKSTLLKSGAEYEILHRFKI